MKPLYRAVYESGPWTVAVPEAGQLVGYCPGLGKSFVIEGRNHVALVMGETVAVTATIPPSALIRCLANAYLLPKLHALLVDITDPNNQMDSLETRTEALHLLHLLNDRLKED